MFKDGDIVEVEWDKGVWFKAVIVGVVVTEHRRDGDIYQWIVRWINPPFKTPWTVCFLHKDFAIRPYKE